MEKEEKLPIPENIQHLKEMFWTHELTRWRMTGYVTGVDRSDYPASLNKVTHVYKGSYGELEKSMCKNGMKDGGFSIFRNNISYKGICKTCLKNTYKELTQK